MNSTVPATAPVAWPRPAQRALLATTPPASVPLQPTAAEDLAIRTLKDHGVVSTRRLDDRTRTTSDLDERHHGTVALFDRGLVELADLTETHAQWRWASVNAEATGLRRLRHRTLGYLPYNLGYRGHTLATLSGPQIVAFLAWHYRHTPVRRLDLAQIATDGTVQVEAVSYDLDGNVIAQNRIEPVPRVADFGGHARRVNPHLDRPERRFAPEVVHGLMTHLTARVAPIMFATPAVSVDLNTWHLHRHGTGPGTFVESLPLDVQDALTTLDAPPLPDRAALSAWARTALRITVVCRTVGESGARRGGHRHTLRLDPDTGETVTVPTSVTPTQEALAGHHLLAALTNDTAGLRCRLVQEAWQRDGRVEDTPDLRWTPTQRDRVLAVHRVAKALRGGTPD